MSWDFWGVILSPFRNIRPPMMCEIFNFFDMSYWFVYLGGLLICLFISLIFWSIHLKARLICSKKWFMKILFFFLIDMLCFLRFNLSTQITFEHTSWTSLNINKNPLYSPLFYLFSISKIIFTIICTHLILTYKKK